MLKVTTLIFVSYLVTNLPAFGDQKDKKSPAPVITMEDVNRRYQALKETEVLLESFLETTVDRERLLSARNGLSAVLNNGAFPLDSDLEKLSRQIQGFQRLYDQYTSDTVTLLMDYSFMMIVELNKNIDVTKIGEKKIEVYLELYSRLVKNFSDFHEFKTPDSPWSDPRGRANAASKNYFKNLEKFDLFLVRNKLAPSLDSPRRSDMLKMSDLRKMLAQLSALPIAYNVLFPQAPHEESPRNLALPKAIALSTRLATSALNYRVRVTNQDILRDALADRTKITIIAPNHTHAYGDLMAMSELLITGDTLVVSALGAISSHEGFLRRGFAHPQVVGVGGGALNPVSPIEKTLQILSRGTSRSILMYPQGRLSAGLSEVGPVAPGFSRNFIAALINAGYEVQIVVPVYMNSQSPLIDDFRALAPTDRTLNVDILKPIASDEVKSLLAMDPEGNLLNAFIRQHWLTFLPTDEHKIAGSMRTSQAFEQLGRLSPVVTINPCARFFNSPKPTNKLVER